MQNIKELIENLNNNFTKTSFGYVDSFGEIYTKKEKDEKITKEIDVAIANNSNLQKEIARKLENGYESNTRIVNKKSKKPKIKKIEFNVVKRDKIMEVHGMELSANAKLTYYVLRDLVEHPTNEVLLNGFIPKIKDLVPLASLSDRSIGKALKELEEKTLIKRINSGHKKSIFVNPIYYATSTQMEKLDPDTLELFNIKIE